MLASRRVGPTCVFLFVQLAIATAGGCKGRVSEVEHVDPRYTQSRWCGRTGCSCPRTRDLQRLVLRVRPPGPETLTIEDLGEAPDLAPLASLPNLRRLEVHKIDPARLWLLASLPRLESLTVQITTAGREVSLAALSRLTRLRVVRIGGLRDRCNLEPFAELRELEEIVVDCRGELDLTPLIGLPKLRSLRVFHATIADSGSVAALARSLAVLDLGEHPEDPQGGGLCEIEPEKSPGPDLCGERRRRERENPDEPDEVLVTAPRR